MSRTVRSANDRFRSCKIPLSCLRHIALCHLAGFVSLFYIDVTRYPRMSCYISFLQTFDTLRFLIQYSVFKVQCTSDLENIISSSLEDVFSNCLYSVPARDREAFASRCIVDTIENATHSPMTDILSAIRNPKFFEPLITGKTSYI